MNAKKYNYTKTDSKIIEKIIDDKNVHLNHVVLPPLERLPEHSTNSNLYLIITKGTMTLSLNDGEKIEYSNCLVNVDYDVKMNLVNRHDSVLEFFIVKSPNPKNFIKEGKKNEKANNRNR